MLSSVLLEMVTMIPLAPASPTLRLPRLNYRQWACGLASGMVLAGVATGAALGQVPNLGAPPTVDTNAAPSVTGGRIVRPTLRPGSQGDAVKELQSMLVLLGYHAGPVSGVYQEDTEAAVKQFQAAAGVTADGIVGPATWSQLFPTPPSEASPPTATIPQSETPSNTPGPTQTTPPASTPPASTPPATSPTARPVLRPGMEGAAVRQLQQALTSNGVYSGPITGFFGPLTEEAVRRLQANNNLEVDGIVGPATWGALD
ncbi:MAG: peptidoglycan-binding protein [Leptolyngbya sp. LCM1.Bin17]|nr:MAG: peptidoglycan-binding protein [Leptolyngbya sp. LCM1.Bin17]